MATTIMHHKGQGRGESKKWARRQAHKWMRRMWKVLREDAPKKYQYYGWWD